jgi:hypothetical protein
MSDMKLMPQQVRLLYGFVVGGCYFRWRSSPRLPWITIPFYSGLLAVPCCDHGGDGQ